ncbi:MAG: hypothetical protein OCU18_09490, partial [Candidatus Syntrophoarchaeum sp.]|nr:hypothetical protein [Candidatus Syntrophoarchaeum sp.]
MKRKISVIVVGAFLTIFFLGNMAFPASGKIVWKAQSSYPAGLPQLYAPAEHFAKLVEKITDGRLVIRMNPGGAIVPSKQIFDAVSTGILDLGCTWAGWWIGK